MNLELKTIHQKKRDYTDYSLSLFPLQAMDGFLLVVTVDGEIFFVSKSVKDYLGYSQVPGRSYLFFFSKCFFKSSYLIEPQNFKLGLI